MTDVELACFHEAAHVLVALEAGCQVGDVMVTPRGGGNAQIRLPARRRDAVMLRLAGAAGEALALGLDVDFEEAAARCEPAALDFALARLDALAGRGEALPALWRQTIDLVERRWPVVVALAEELQQAGIVSGARAVSILSAGHR
jgi:hypothetical protein